MKTSLSGIILATLTLISFGCKSGDCPAPQQTELMLIRDGGPVELDGCGWYFDTSFGLAKPAVFPDSLKVDSLSVLVTYTHTGNRVGCGLLPEAGDEIELLQVIVQ